MIKLNHPLLIAAILMLFFASCTPTRVIQRPEPPVYNPPADTSAETAPARPIDPRDTMICDDHGAIHFMGEAAEKKLRRKIMDRDLDTTIYRIPVVAHIIYSGTTGNISDAQVQSGIDLLNDYWRAKGRGAGGTDMRVEFGLAQRDPQGNPTTGIVRVDGSVLGTNYVTNGITKSANVGLGAKELDVKSLSFWPNNQYVNIWITTEINGNNAGAGVIGYAYFPLPTGDKRDGIVMQYTSVGTKDRNADGQGDAGSASFVLNEAFRETLAHEMGHVFGLYHTFEGTSGCPSTETNCATQGDRCCDTKPQWQSSSCTIDFGCTGADMKNMMSYTNCKSRFTPDQAARARATLKNSRPGLLTSKGLIAPQSLDAGIALFSSTLTCSSNYTPQVLVTNYGTQAITSVKIGAVTYGVSIATGKSVTITLPPMSTPSIALYDLVIGISQINGVNDPYAANNTVNTKISHIVGRDLSVDLVADFYASETSWEIRDANNALVQSKSGYPDLKCKIKYTTDFCLPPGTYTFIANDTHKDAQYFTPYCNASITLRQGTAEIKKLPPCWCTIVTSGTSTTCPNCSTTSFQFTIQ